MKKRTAGIIKTVIIGVICVGIVVGFYYKGRAESYYNI